MQKIINIKDKKTSGNDLNYWLSKSPEERFAALESLRQQYIELTNAPTRMQKLINITYRKNKNTDKY